MAKPKQSEPETYVISKPPHVIEEVRVERVSNERWRVTTAKYQLVPGTEKVLEDGRSLPVARSAAIAWRARNGGIGKDLP